MVALASQAGPPPPGPATTTRQAPLSARPTISKRATNKAERDRKKRDKDAATAAAAKAAEEQRAQECTDAIVAVDGRLHSTAGFFAAYPTAVARRD
eukprot:COSAG01_NODE_53883_length_336_cov_0.624473_1_plen_95_part_01